MLKAFGLVVICFTSSLSNAAAKQFEVSAKMYVDGQLHGTPKLLSLAGEEAKIEVGNGEKDRFSLGVVANDSTADKISIKLDGEFVKGDRIIKGTSRVVTKANETTTVHLGKDGALKFEFVVTPIEN